MDAAAGKNRIMKIVSIMIAIVVVLLFFVIEIYPLIWTVLCSFKMQAEFFRPAWNLPETLHWENYSIAWVGGKLNLYLKNTVLVTFTSMIVVFFLSSTSAFALCKMRFKLQRTLTLVFLLGMLVPVFVMLIPELLLFKWMGIGNTLWCLIIHFSAQLSMPMYMMIGYYKYIPNDLMEAAIIDGCSIYKVYSKIMLPLSKNAFVTVIMITFFQVWNDLIASKTFVTNPKLKMLQVGLMGFAGEYGTRQWGPTFAGIVISVFPIAIIYMFLSNQIIKGMTAGAVKG